MISDWKLPAEKVWVLLSSSFIFRVKGCVHLHKSKIKDFSWIYIHIFKKIFSTQCSLSPTAWLITFKTLRLTKVRLLGNKMVGMTFWKLISQAFPPLSLSLSLSSFLFFPALLLHRALHLTRKRAGNSAFKNLAWASFMWQLFQWLSHLYGRYLTTVGFVFICCRRRMDCQYIWKADMEFLWPGSLSYCQAFLIYPSHTVTCQNLGYWLNNYQRYKKHEND